MDWACKNSNGMSRGMLTIWSNEAFCKVDSWFGNGFLVVNGF